MKKFKTPIATRRRTAKYKLNNWEKVKTYARGYMRKYRSKEPGKTIVREAQARYMKSLPKGTQYTYMLLRELAKKDGLWGKNPSRRTKQVGGWKIRRIKG